MFVVHGLSDYNVQPNHVGQWWAALAKYQVPRKIWLGLEDHVDPFEFRRAEWVDELHKWFDYWLQGLRNDVMREPIASVETAPDTWAKYRTWPQRTDVPVPLGEGKLGASGRGNRHRPRQPGADRGRHRGTPVRAGRRPADVPVRPAAGWRSGSAVRRP